jgi:hypothetical protein
MSKLPESRLEWLKHYCREKGLLNNRGEPGSAELAEKIDRSQNYCSQLLLDKKSFGEDIARHIEEKLNLLKWDLDGGAGWPFRGVDRRRFDALTNDQKLEIQGLVRKAITDFEVESATLAAQNRRQA